MGEYLVADNLYGFSLEIGDHVRTKTGQEFIINGIVSIDEGYELHFTDLFIDEEEVYLLEEDETVDLLIPE